MGIKKQNFLSASKAEDAVCVKREREQHLPAGNCKYRSLWHDTDKSIV